MHNNMPLIKSSSFFGCLVFGLKGKSLLLPFSSFYSAMCMEMSLIYVLLQIKHNIKRVTEPCITLIFSFAESTVSINRCLTFSNPLVPPLHSFQSHISVQSTVPTVSAETKPYLVSLKKKQKCCTSPWAQPTKNKLAVPQYCFSHSY